MVGILFLAACSSRVEMEAFLNVSEKEIGVGSTLRIELDYSPRIGDAVGVIEIDGKAVRSSEEFPVVYDWTPGPDDVGEHVLSGFVTTMFGEKLEPSSVTVLVRDETPPNVRFEFIPSFKIEGDEILVPVMETIKMLVGFEDPESKAFRLRWRMDESSGDLEGLKDVELVDLGILRDPGIHLLRVEVTNDEGLSTSTVFKLRGVEDESPPRAFLNAPGKLDVNRALVVSFDSQDDNELEEFWIEIDGLEVYRGELSGRIVSGYRVNLGLQTEGYHVVSLYVRDLVGKVGWDTEEVYVGESPIGLELRLSDPGPDGYYSKGETVVINVEYSLATPVDVDIFVDGDLIGRGMETSWIAQSGVHTVSALATSDRDFEWCHKLVRVVDDLPPHLSETLLNGEMVDSSSPLSVDPGANVVELTFEDESGFSGSERLLVYLSERPQREDIVDFLSLNPLSVSADGKRVTYRFTYDFKDFSGKTLYLSVSGLSDIEGNSMDPLDVLVFNVRE